MCLQIIYEFHNSDPLLVISQKNEKKLTERLKTGHLILFVAVLTNLVVTAFTGFSIILFGLAS